MQGSYWCVCNHDGAEHANTMPNTAAAPPCHYLLPSSRHGLPCPLRPFKCSKPPPALTRAWASAAATAAPKPVRLRFEHTTAFCRRPRLLLLLMPVSIHRRPWAVAARARHVCLTAAAAEGARPCVPATRPAPLLLPWCHWRLPPRHVAACALQGGCCWALAIRWGDIRGVTPRPRPSHSLVHIL